MGLNLFNSYFNIFWLFLQKVKMLRSIISLFMIALLVFPIVEKLEHELDHLTVEHCTVEGLHFCESEHTCSVCDYVISPSGLIQNFSELKLHLTFTAAYKALQITPIFSRPIHHPQLRGPPPPFSIA